MPPTMLDAASDVSALLLALTFAWACVAKLARWRRWRVALESYRLGYTLSRSARVGVPLAEAGVVVLVATGRARIAAALVVALLSAFSLVVVRARTSSGDKLPCGCFGRTQARDYREMLVRNALLGSLAAIVLVAARGQARAWELPAGGETLPAVLTATGVVLLAWLAWQVTTTLKRRT